MTASNPRTMAYARFETSSESSNLPGAGKRGLEYGVRAPVILRKPAGANGGTSFFCEILHE